MSSKPHTSLTLNIYSSSPSCERRETIAYRLSLSLTYNILPLETFSTRPRNILHTDTTLVFRALHTGWQISSSLINLKRQVYKVDN